MEKSKPKKVKEIKPVKAFAIIVGDNIILSHNPFDKKSSLGIYKTRAIARKNTLAFDIIPVLISPIKKINKK